MKFFLLCIFFHFSEDAFDAAKSSCSFDRNSQLSFFSVEQQNITIFMCNIKVKVFIPLCPRRNLASKKKKKCVREWKKMSFLKLVYACIFLLLGMLPSEGLSYVYLLSFSFSLFGTHIHNELTKSAHSFCDEWILYLLPFYHPTNFNELFVEWIRWLHEKKKNSFLSFDGEDDDDDFFFSVVANIVKIIVDKTYKWCLYNERCS